MTKQLFELLTIERLKESKLLLDAGCYSGAYYLVGYAVECGLKAVIVKQVNAHEIPSKAFVLDFYVHDLERLIKLAGIDQAHKSNLKSNQDFRVNWNTVNNWNEGARYKEWTQIEANDLYNAVNNLNGGILAWIQRYW